MTQEEKARAYDEALEKGRIFRDHLLETGDKGIAGEIEYIFPALSQSEDEQIRKALIEMVHDTTGDELWVDYNVHKEDALAWLEKQCYTKKDVDDAYLKGISDAKNELEKQGEQKPFDYEHATITQKGFAPKPTEWSDEDENYLQSAENACEYQYGKNTSTILWLKSLKDRVRGKEDKHGNL